MRLLLLAILAAMPAEAAFTLQGSEKPARLTMAATWGELTIPATTDYLVIRPISAPAKLGVGCVDGAAVGSNYLTLSADVAVTWSYTEARQRNLTVCLAGTDAAIVEVVPMRRGL